MSDGHTAKPALHELLVDANDGYCARRGHTRVEWSVYDAGGAFAFTLPVDLDPTAVFHVIKWYLEGIALGRALGQEY